MYKFGSGIIVPGPFETNAGAQGTLGQTLTSGGPGLPWTWGAAATGGTVTSVGLSAPAIFTVSGSPVTGSGTLTFTQNTQNANLVFAGPSTGSAATPTFRALVTADFPTSGVTAATYTIPTTTFDATGRATSATEIYSTSTFTVTDGSGAGLSLTSAFRYIKIGKLVHIQGSVTYPATASGATAQLNNFPFTTVSSAARAGLTIGFKSGPAALYSILMANNAASADFRDATGSGLTNAQLTGATIFLTGSYEST